MAVESQAHQNGVHSKSGRGSWIKSVVLSLFVLAAGAGVTGVIFFTEPTAVRVDATKETAMLVEVVRVQRGTYQPVIAAMGTIIPAEDLILSPRVQGIVVKRSEAFTPGGYVEKGHTLLQIEAADYKNILEQKRTELKRAIADLNIEMGMQDVAQKELQLLKEDLPAKDEALVLRRPQLNAVKARVEAARVAVAQAELDLQRTRIKAPFDAHILSRNANVGSRVSPGDDLGRLVGVDTYWVETSVPLSKLRWLSFPKAPGEMGSEVRVRHKTAWPKGVDRTGRLYKLLGALEQQTRMARVLVSVDDPLNFRSARTDLPPLIIGAYVEVQIQAGALNDVIRLRREHVRKGDTVWVMKGDRLDIRPVQIAFTDETHAFIEGGLTEADQVVTTSLSTVVNGAKLRVNASAAPDASVAGATRDAGPETDERPLGGSR